MNAPTERREVRYRGHVQGVGFRYTAVRIARRYDVTGYVKNLPDGRVELVAEGAPEDIDALLTEIADEMSGNIRETQQDRLPPRDEFPDFRIAY
jgi:acylphosphatase